MAQAVALAYTAKDGKNGGRVASKDAQQFSAAGVSDLAHEIERLATLHLSAQLTDSEFVSAKAALIAEANGSRKVPLPPIVQPAASASGGPRWRWPVAVLLVTLGSALAGWGLAQTKPGTAETPTVPVADIAEVEVDSEFEGDSEGDAEYWAEQEEYVRQQQDLEVQRHRRQLEEQRRQQQQMQIQQQQQQNLQDSIGRANCFSGRSGNGGSYSC